jgi:hypothetical protein
MGSDMVMFLGHGGDWESESSGTVTTQTGSTGHRIGESESTDLGQPRTLEDLSRGQEYEATGR